MLKAEYIWSAIIRINTEGKSLLMKSSPDPLLYFKYTRTSV